MEMEQFLAGRVTKTSLPVAEPGVPGAPLLKRLLLPQGALAQIYDGNEGMRYLAWLELRSGAVRGNHVHQRKHEYFYLIAGEVELVVQDGSTGERAGLNLVAGGLVYLAAGVAHAYRPLTGGEAVEFSPVRFDPADTVREVVLAPVC
jgi:mannose-6-phosphate isomerase-like protein (cupin superfamily)